MAVSLIRDTLPEFVWGARDNHDHSLSKIGFQAEVWTRVLPSVNQKLYPDFCVFQSAEQYLCVSIPFVKNAFPNSNSVCCIWPGNGEKSGKEKYPDFSYCKLGQLIHRCFLTLTAGRSDLFFFLSFGKGYDCFFFQFVVSFY